MTRPGSPYPNPASMLRSTQRNGNFQSSPCELVVFLKTFNQEPNGRLKSRTMYVLAGGGLKLRILLTKYQVGEKNAVDARHSEIPELCSSFDNILRATSEQVSVFLETFNQKLDGRLESRTMYVLSNESLPLVC